MLLISYYCNNCIFYLFCFRFPFTSTRWWPIHVSFFFSLNFCQVLNIVVPFIINILIFLNYRSNDNLCNIGNFYFSLPNEEKQNLKLKKKKQKTGTCHIMYIVYPRLYSQTDFSKVYLLLSSKAWNRLNCLELIHTLLLTVTYQHLNVLKV